MTVITNKLSIRLLQVMYLMMNATIAMGQKNAPEIKGSIVDSVSNQPVTGATIKVSSRGILYSRSGVSNENGGFDIPLTPGADLYTIRVSYTGYRAVAFDFSTSHTDKILIKLVPQTTALDSVVVRGSRKFLVSKIDRTVVLVSSSPYANVGSSYTLLQMMPGVILQQDGSVLLNGKIVEVWLDGRPSKLTGTQLKSFLDGLNSNSINKVELISNPSAAFDGQTAAVINIITNKPKTDGATSNINLIAGQGKYLRLYPGADFNYRNKNWNLFGSYNFQHTIEKINNVSQRSIGDSSMETGFTNEAVKKTFISHNLKLGADVQLGKKNYIGFTVYALLNTTNQDVSNSTSFQNRSGLIDSSTAVISNNGYKYNSPSANLYFRSNLDSMGKQLEVNLDTWSVSRDENSNFNNFFYDANGNPLRNNLLFKTATTGRNRLYSAKIDYTSPSKHGEFITGAKSYFAKTNNSFDWEDDVDGNYIKSATKSNQFIYDENVNAIYAGWEGHFKKLSYQGVLRAENTVIEGVNADSGQKLTRNYTNLFPSVILQYPISLRHELKLTYRRTITRPLFSELNPFIKYENEYSYTEGNTRLKPEKTDGFDLVYSYDHALFLTLSYSNTIDAITQTYSKSSSQDSLISTYDNLGKSQKLQLNISYNAYIKNKWLISYSSALFYNYVNTVFQNVNVINNGTGLNSFFFNSYQLPKDFSADLLIAYTSSYHGTIFRYESSGYVSIGIHKKILNKNGMINLFFSNPFYNSRLSYSTDFNNIRFRYSSYQDTRFLNLSFFYRIGNKAVKENIKRNSGIDSEKSRLNN